MKQLEKEENSSGKKYIQIWNNEVKEAIADKKEHIKFVSRTNRIITSGIFSRKKIC
jgi:hypothetical protein